MVYDLNNYDINAFEIGRGHKCPGTEIDVYLKSHKTPVIGVKEMKCELVKIDNDHGHPKFHFEINGKFYVYSVRGIKADYRMALFCTKRPVKVEGENRKSKCGNNSTILPSEFLRKNIQNAPKNSQYPKFLDKSDPKFFDINNYNISSFDIGRGHKCAGIELDRYIEKNRTKIPLR
jgi:hypothetical protein